MMDRALESYEANNAPRKRPAGLTEQALGVGSSASTSRRSPSQHLAEVDAKGDTKSAELDIGIEPYFLLQQIQQRETLAANQAVTEDHAAAERQRKQDTATPKANVPVDWKLKRKRALNNEASRRKRARIKLKHAKLEEEYGVLMKSQMQLKSENHWLELLVAQANTIVQQLIGGHIAEMPRGTTSQKYNVGHALSVPNSTSEFQSQFQMQSQPTKDMPSYPGIPQTNPTAPSFAPHGPPWVTSVQTPFVPFNATLPFAQFSSTPMQSVLLSNSMVFPSVQVASTAMPSLLPPPNQNASPQLHQLEASPLPPVQGQWTWDQMPLHNEQQLTPNALQQPPYQDTGNFSTGHNILNECTITQDLFDEGAKSLGTTGKSGPWRQESKDSR